MPGFRFWSRVPIVDACAILSKTATSLATKMVGTGPWEEVSYTPDVSITMKRYTGYWGPKTATQNLKMLFIPDSTTQEADFEAGTVDIIMPPESEVSSLKSDANAVVNPTPSANIPVLEFNREVKPFNNVDVRRAVAVALDRSTLAQLAYGGSATPTSEIPPGLSWETPLSRLPYSTYNPAEAKQLLAKAGYSSGVNAGTLQYITAYDFGTNALMSAVQSELAAVGITVTLEPEQVAAWIANSNTSYAHMTMTWNENPYYADPALYVKVLSFEYGPGKGGVPAELTKLTNKALAASNNASFDSGLNAVESYEASVVYPQVPLLAINNFVAFQKGMTGVSVPTSGSTDFLANVKGS